MILKDFFNVEFHCHTIASKDSLTKPKDLISMAHKRGLDRLVITDHNTISGALEAHAIDPELVTVGEEIMTTKGEILAAYVLEGIPAGRTAQEAIKRLKGHTASVCGNPMNRTVPIVNHSTSTGVSHARTPPT